MLLQSTTLGAAGMALNPALSAGRAFAGSAPEVPQMKSFEFEETTISDLQTRLKSGELTTRFLTEAYLHRIQKIDKNGPTLNSVIELNPDALSIAESLDREHKQKSARGPLHGIPVLIKDNIDTADRMQTTAGSLALVGSKPAQDSGVARKLREAGAVILGKTNLSEWANIRSNHSTSGWSGRGGLTTNPRQDQLERMGQYPFQPFHQRMERARRSHDKSLCSRPESVRIEFRLGRSHFGEPLRCRSWDRDRRFDRMPIVGKRHCWYQAHAGVDQPRRNYSNRSQPGHRRSHGANCARRGDFVISARRI